MKLTRFALMIGKSQGIGEVEQGRFTDPLACSRFALGEPMLVFLALLLFFARIPER